MYLAAGIASAPEFPWVVIVFVAMVTSTKRFVSLSYNLSG